MYAPSGLRPQPSPQDALELCKMGTNRGPSVHHVTSLIIVLLQLSLQLSDDSDFEGHPNVDKKSFIQPVFLSRNRYFR